MGQKKVTVDTSFWTDSKVDGMFSSEDKYFAMYLLTNSFINKLGIFEFPVKLAAAQLGWSEENVFVLLNRFETKYGFLRYSKETGEVAIKNRLKFLDRGGKPILDELMRDKKKVKDVSLLRYIEKNLLKNTEDLNKTVIEFLNEIHDQKPEYNEVKEYCIETGSTVNPETFYQYYEKRKWMIGNRRIYNWKSKLKEWERNQKQQPKTNRFNNFHQRNYDYDRLEQELLISGGIEVD